MSSSFASVSQIGERDRLITVAERLSLTGTPLNLVVDGGLGVRGQPFSAASINSMLRVDANTRSKLLIP